MRISDLSADVCSSDLSLDLGRDLRACVDAEIARAADHQAVAAPVLDLVDAGDLVLALLGDARRLGVIRAVHVANAQPDRRRARFLVGTRMADRKSTRLNSSR